jgi:rhomboid family GlyGly-CTERM serine protease
MFGYTKTKGLSLLLTALTLISILLVGQNYAAIFQYDRSAIMAGEYWRIITCHFVHSGWEHLFLNVIGVVFIYCLFDHLYSPVLWLLSALCCMIGISLSFLIFCPALEWYNGLSGLLHALLLMGIIGELKNGNKFYYFGLLGIIGKFVMDYFAGPLDLTSQFTKTLVVTSAHFSGIIIGGATGCIIMYLEKLLPGQSTRMAAGSTV